MVLTQEGPRSLTGPHRAETQNKDTAPGPGLVSCSGSGNQALPLEAKAQDRVWLSDLTITHPLSMIPEEVTSDQHKKAADHI